MEQRDPFLGRRPGEADAEGVSALLKEVGLHWPVGRAQSGHHHQAVLHRHCGIVARMRQEDRRRVGADVLFWRTGGDQLVGRRGAEQVLA